MADVSSLYKENYESPYADVVQAISISSDYSQVAVG